MPDEDLINILKQGAAKWNYWRSINGNDEIDFSGVDLSNMNLSGANLISVRMSEANLANVDLSKAILTFGKLQFANLTGANLSEADLLGTDFSFAKMAGTNLKSANLRQSFLAFADMRGTDLSGAFLIGAMLVHTNLRGANLTDCSIYGVSVWGADLENATQSNLMIKGPIGPAFTVDDIEVAQFIYILLNNKRIRNIIDTITTKVVLILGRFTPERKAVLYALKQELRMRNYIPIVFDFEPPSSRNLTETVTTLARLARFIIADITEPRSVPQELYATIPHLPSVPVQPILQVSESEYGMFPDFQDYSWVLATYKYKDIEDLLSSFNDKIIAPAESKVRRGQSRIR
jgi:hypothetical protein